jgi:hypothetical protein
VWPPLFLKTAAISRYQKEESNFCPVLYALIAVITQNRPSRAGQNSKEQSRIDSEKGREVIGWITWRLLKLLAVFKPYLTLFWRFQDKYALPLHRPEVTQSIYNIQNWKLTTHNTPYGIPYITRFRISMSSIVSSPVFLFLGTRTNIINPRRHFLSSQVYFNENIINLKCGNIVSFDVDFFYPLL